MKAMEGWLEKKGWFSSWKMRYLKCDEDTINVYKLEDDSSTKQTFSTHGCRVKEVGSETYARPYVFSLKFDDGKLIFAAEDAEDYDRWIGYFRQFIKRPSLAVMKTPRFSDVSDIIQAESHAPLAFDSKKLVTAVDNAIRVGHGAQAQFALADLCTEFLSTVHKHVESRITDDQPVDGLFGIDIVKIEDSERPQYKKLIKGSLAIMRSKIDGIYCPLQCIIDAFDGSSYFAATTIEDQKRGTFNDSSRAKMRLFKLAFGVDDYKALKFTQDRYGNLWVLDSSLVSEDSKMTAAEIVTALKKSYVFDSATLVEAMKTLKVPVSRLPEIMTACDLPEMQQLCLCEMIARCCKAPFREHLRKGLSPVQFFNTVIGENDETMTFWSQVIDKELKEKFGLDPIRDVIKPMLFNSLQFHLGIDMIDSLDFDFDSAAPFAVSDMICKHTVLRHNLFTMCDSMKEKKYQSSELLREQQYSKAIKVLNHRITLYQTLHGEQNPYIRRDMAFLALAQMQSQDMETAQMCLESLSCRENSIAHCLAMPVCLTSENAEELVNDGREIISCLLGDNSYVECHFLCLMSTAIAKAGDSELALRVAEDAIAVYSCEDSLLNKARITYAMGDYVQAFNALKEIKQPTLSGYYYLFADVLMSNRQFSAAIAYAIKAYNMRLRLFKKEQVLYESVQQIAEIYEALEEHSSALLFYQKLLEYLVSFSSNVIMETITVTQNILRVYFNQMRFPIKTDQVPETALKSTTQQLLVSDPLEYVNIYQQTRSAELSSFIRTPAARLADLCSA